MKNNFECKFYEEKLIDNEKLWKCQNVQYCMPACKQKDGFCGYYEDCEYCKNQDTEKCADCYLGKAEC